LGGGLAYCQESVFVANLDNELAARMLERIGKTVDVHWARPRVSSLSEVQSAGSCYRNGGNHQRSGLLHYLSAPLI